MADCDHTGCECSARVTFDGLSSDYRRRPDVRESRRLFYVGFTRPKEELLIVHTVGRPSPFVREVQARLEQA